MLTVRLYAALIESETCSPTGEHIDSNRPHMLARCRPYSRLLAFRYRGKRGRKYFAAVYGIAYYVGLSRGHDSFTGAPIVFQFSILQDVFARACEKTAGGLSDCIRSARGGPRCMYSE